VGQDFERVVDLYYAGLYRLAFSLTRNETEACDLTQQTYYLWATRGDQLRDPSKAKSWLFTTLYREFLKTRRRADRFPHRELSEVEEELPHVPPGVVRRMDWRTVVEALARVEEVYQAPLAMFYLEDLSYREIAAVLQVPIGTVMSRIARGRARLQAMLLENSPATERNVIPFPQDSKRAPHDQ